MDKTDITKVFQLLESPNKQNFQLALQLLKGDSKLKKSANNRYLELIQFHKRKTIKSLFNILQKYREQGLYHNSLKILKLLPISFLEQLPKVYLIEQMLTEIPKKLKYCSNIKNLSLYGNEIEKLPNFIWKLDQLEVVVLSANKISKLSPQIGNLTNLRTFLMTHNGLETLPSSMGNFTKLKYLDLSNNQLQKVPNSLMDLPHLITIKLQNNLFSTEMKSKLSSTFSKSSSLHI